MGGEGCASIEVGNEEAWDAQRFEGPSPDSAEREERNDWTPGATKNEVLWTVTLKLRSEHSILVM